MRDVRHHEELHREAGLLERSRALALAGDLGADLAGHERDRANARFS